MSLTLLASNNASTVLASSINASATTLTVNTGAGSLFPSPVSGTSFFKLTLVDAATGQLTEIVHVTARAGDVMTIERAQEGTAARVWSANDIAANMMTAGTLSYILGSFQPLDATLTALAGLTGSADKLAYFNGDDTAALTALTTVGRDIIGKSSIADVLSYLGLGEGSALPVGVPVPWPSATPPTGWLKCNGAPFSAEEHPELAKVYPTNKLPDLRGEFIRGWDDGRGVDGGRVVLTGQSQSVQQHTHGLAMAYSSESGYKDKLGAGPNSDMIPIKDMIKVTTFTGSGEYYLKANDSTGVETRPRNVAFNFIVRAA